MNSQQLAFVLVKDEAGFLEPVHEKANARTGRPNHLGQRLMLHLWNRGLGCPMAIEMSEQQKNTRQSFLAGTAMSVNQVMLVSDVPRQHISPKYICQLYVPGQGAEHDFFSIRSRVQSVIAAAEALRED